MTTETTTAVTACLDNLEAVSEFWTHNDTCGETAFLCGEHCKAGVTLDGPSVDEVRADMARRGYGVAGGTVMGDLCGYFHNFRGLDVLYTNGYGSSWDAIHQTLLDHAGRDGVVLEVELADMLTGNEKGVRRHYVFAGAIHPTLGYGICNGDDVRALNAAGGHGKVIPVRWMSAAVLASAKPSAAAIIRGLSYTPSIPASLLELPQAHIVDGFIVDGPAPELPAEAAGASDTGELEAGASDPGELLYSVAGHITDI